MNAKPYTITITGLPLDSGQAKGLIEEFFKRIRGVEMLTPVIALDYRKSATHRTYASIIMATGNQVRVQFIELFRSVYPDHNVGSVCVRMIAVDTEYADVYDEAVDGYIDAPTETEVFVQFMSDDRQAFAEFDGAEWFAQAEDGELIGIVEDEFDGGSIFTKRIADFANTDAHPDVQAVFKYAEENGGLTWCYPFESHGIAWIRKHRPNLASHPSIAKYGVKEPS